VINRNNTGERWEARVSGLRDKIRAAKKLAAQGRVTAALKMLGTLRQLHPKNALVWLESAFAMDRLGREAQAIPLYERAISLGLEDMAMRDALVCLGSSLRTVGRAREAVKYLAQAQKQFPGDVVVELFLALGYHDVRQPTHALRLTALACLRESGDRGLAAYRDVLKRKFNSLGRNRSTRRRGTAVKSR
jgi:Flp pilus assembly protein TadD